MSELLLKVLDPVEDIFFFQDAYSWRKDKKHAQPDRTSFKDFVSRDERQIVIGAFNGDFLAVFLLYEWQKGGYYEAHFTSKRGIPRPILIDAGKMVRDAFFQNGAQELCAWIVKRNSALRGYLEDLGFVAVEEKEFPCQSDLNRVISSRLPRRSFVKYGCVGERK
jgi:hypothetical protein